MINKVMKMKKILLIAVLSLLLFSCKNSILPGNTFTFTIKNNSSNKIEGKIYSKNATLNKIDSLEINLSIDQEEISKWKKPDLGNSDGEFYIKTNSISQDFGYFSNGYTSLKEYEIDIYNDSIIVETIIE